MEYGFEYQGDYLDQLGTKKILEEIELANDQQYFEENSNLDYIQKTKHLSTHKI